MRCGIIMGMRRVNLVSTEGASPEQMRRIERLIQDSNLRADRKDQWLSRVYQVEATLLSVAAPVSLAVGIGESSSAPIAAATLCSAASLVLGTVRLYAPVRSASLLLLEDIESAGGRGISSCPPGWIERWSERAFLAFAGLSFVLVLVPVFRSFSFQALLKSFT